MKTKKSLILAILGVALLTAITLYRKHRKAVIRGQQLKEQQEFNKKLLKHQQERAKQKRQRVLDSIQNADPNSLKNKAKANEEKTKKLKELLKKLNEEETKKK